MNSMQAVYRNLGHWRTKFIREICNEEDIELRLLSHGWLMELTKANVTKRVLGHVFDLNSSAASSIARDKVATYELLAMHDIPAIPHYIARTDHDATLTHDFSWSEGVVVKPVNGQAGDDVRLFRDSKKAHDYMQKNREVAWSLSPLQEMLREIRVIMLDGKVLQAYAKQPAIIKGLRVFNLSKGAEPIDHVLTGEQEALAERAQKTMGLRLFAVDLAELVSGELKVLEVNSTISMEQYAAYSIENVKHVKEVYRAIIKAMFKEVY
jgi:glutathione synthase/RimK-type ligase-like ATP-grasp enzyme